jgi:metal-responsive CopG/Arc/MetJ family transcriptional regulator
MSRRRHEQDQSKKVAVSVTIDKELFDFIEMGIRNRWWQSRSHAINMIGYMFMQNQQRLVREQTPSMGMPPHFGRSPQSERKGL